jgi:hypothetical protein
MPVEALRRGGLMTLDLDELTLGWECPSGELTARVVVGRDGRELFQLRVDLGVMQMFSDGRPDGQRYRGHPGAAAYIAHELRIGGDVLPQDWLELDREVTQTNYRRIAAATVAEAALRANNEREARRYLHQALEDIRTCLTDMQLMKERSGPLPDELANLYPTLVFDRARLAAQVRIIEGQFEDAIEQAEAGAVSLETLLTRLGYDDEQRAEDPALRYLQTLSRQLRREYGVTLTLTEQLAQAVANEDFETAAELRDELERRQSAVRFNEPPALPPPGE